MSGIFATPERGGCNHLTAAPCSVLVGVVGSRGSSEDYRKRGREDDQGTARREGCTETARTRYNGFRTG